MATHSSLLAWRIPWMEEPGEPQSIASQNPLDTTERLTHSLTQLKLYFEVITGLWEAGKAVRDPE